MLQSPLLGLGEEDEADLTDWNLPLAFMKKRHCEKIEGSKSLAQSWRMKDRMKTVSVALVLCLNVGVDPPDVVKTTPCARLECWIDPLSMGPQKALETIGANLQKQYENWQPRVSLLSAVLWVSCRGLRLLAVRQSLNPGEEHFRSPRPGTPRWTTPYTPLVPRPPSSPRA